MPSDSGERVARIEGELVGIRHVQSTTRTTISVVVAVLLGGLTLVTIYNSWRFSRIEQDIAAVRTELNARAERIETKVDSLPDRVSEQISRAVSLTLQAYQAGQGDRANQVPLQQAPNLQPPKP